MRMHRQCPQCFEFYSDGTEAFDDGECPYCITCEKCDDFIAGEFDEMWSHHVEKHDHDRFHPLHPEDNYRGVELEEAEECHCNPH